MRIGSPVEHGTYQSRFEVLQEAHGLNGRLAPGFEQLRLAVALEKTLVLAQRLLDFVIAGERLFVEDAQAFGGLAFGVVEVTDAVFAHQSRRFLGDA
ncbi:hypothetical protein GCM10007863_12860 [Dyella mobilis]|nr:hypothetical protein GCM10007863_12860 [Dyella mobilis]